MTLLNWSSELTDFAVTSALVVCVDVYDCHDRLRDGAPGRGVGKASLCAAFLLAGLEMDDGSPRFAVVSHDAALPPAFPQGLDHARAAGGEGSDVRSDGHAKKLIRYLLVESARDAPAAIAAQPEVQLPWVTDAVRGPDTILYPLRLLFAFNVLRI
jgi:hypothetical protein